LREFARAVNVDPATLCRIEKAKGCDLETLVRIHQETGLKYELLLGPDN